MFQLPREGASALHTLHRSAPSKEVPHMRCFQPQMRHHTQPPWGRGSLPSCLLRQELMGTTWRFRGLKRDDDHGTCTLLYTHTQGTHAQLCMHTCKHTHTHTAYMCRHTLPGQWSPEQPGRAVAVELHPAHRRTCRSQ